MKKHVARGVVTRGAVVVCLLFLTVLDLRADDYTVTFFANTAIPYITYIDTTTGVTLVAPTCNLVPSGFTICSIPLSGIAVPFTTTIPFNFYGLVNIAQQADPSLIADQLSYDILSPNSEVLLNFVVFPQGSSFRCVDYGDCGFTQAVGLQITGSITEGNDPITVAFQSAPLGAVPEPSSALLMLTGFAGLTLLSVRRGLAGRLSKG